MTKKDYELIAGGIREAIKYIREESKDKLMDAERATKFETIGVIEASIARALGRDNPKFNADKFYQACRKV
jgi:hypothetical protein